MTVTLPLVAPVAGDVIATEEAAATDAALGKVEPAPGSSPENLGPHAPGDVPNQYTVVKGGTTPPPQPGTVYSGSQGQTLNEAAAGVPHGQVQSTTAAAIRNAGGQVEVAPEFNPKVGATNYQHVDVTDGPAGSPLGPPQPNPVPKDQRFGGANYDYGRGLNDDGD